MSEIYAGRFASWAAGQGGAVPTLDFAEPRWSLGIDEMKIFKRRLSQLSRMTIHVIHEIMPLKPDTRMVFISFRGEIGRQYKINKSLIEDGEILPAAFSLSVFNAPAAAASIALGLTAGYTALYPVEGRFDAGVLAAAAPLLGGGAEELLLVYADEQVPLEYGDLGVGVSPPLAFAVLLSSQKTSGSIPVFSNGDFCRFKDPADFLGFLVQSGIPRGSGSGGRS